MKRLLFSSAKHGGQTSAIGQVVGSPVLLVLLLGATFFAAASWYRADAAQRAPEVGGFSWTRHPNALMIVYPTKSCGCGAAPLVRVQEGLEHGLDVVVIAPTVSDELKPLLTRVCRFRALFWTPMQIKPSCSVSVRAMM